eukprot:CAMPEP_0176428464 /NCGR_PEP_ID=MMETSP0127-20121128/13165_1 /TAXON_ID=938130 /ORGANISM="Platyophrya macrostoma, Strain WH" /LENGTH=131 /DNA_ID=CAMNT_0017810151 /DNA_START=53 /DNA_END=448 /DNA_ORIENTATION=+
MIFTFYWVYLTFRATRLDPSKKVTIPNKEFTIEELANFNGKREKKVYIAIQNLVFDVTASGNYGPGDAYSLLAGKECSVVFAKMSFEEGYLNAQNKVSITKEENEILRKWSNMMKQKYPVVGKLVQEKKNH